MRLAVWSKPARATRPTCPTRCRRHLSPLGTLPAWPLKRNRHLGELAGLTRTLPNPHLLIRPFVRREAVLSSRIEGTQASLSDLFFLRGRAGSGGWRFRCLRGRQLCHRTRGTVSIASQNLPVSLRLMG